jgi:hypothetical protein
MTHLLLLKGGMEVLANQTLRCHKSKKVKNHHIQVPFGFREIYAS